jgi:sulfur carrier protein
MKIEMSDPHIQVWVNQINTTLTAPAFLADAVHVSGIQPPFAAAVNMQFVPKKNYATHALQPGDKIELIVPVTGG